MIIGKVLGCVRGFRNLVKWHYLFELKVIKLGGVVWLQHSYISEIVKCF